MDERETDGAESKTVRPDVETAVAVADLASDLHEIYDQVVTKSLPIYFGPLLGELFLADR